MAGRSIGRVEVSVDADTGKLKAQIVKASEEAGEAGGEAIEEGLADVNGREVVNKIKKIRAEIQQELRGLDVDVGVDDANARADLRRLQAQLRALQLSLDVVPGVDQTKVLEEIVQLRERIAKLLKVSTKVELDQRTVTEVNAAVQALIDEHVTVHVEPEVDDAQAAAAMARLRAQAETAGSSSGGGFMQAFSGALFDQEKLAAAAIGLLGNDIAILLQGAVAASVAVVSSAFGALTAAIGAALPLIASLIPALGAVVVGFQGMGDALGAVTKGFKEATAAGQAFDITSISDQLQGLAPAARAFVEEFARIFPQLQAIQQQVQGALFANLDAALGELATTTIPSIGQALTVAAESINTFFLKIAQASEGIDFGGLIEDLQPAIDAVGDALVSLFQSFAPFIEAATPAAQRLAESFRAAADGLREMIESGLQSGAINDFLQRGLDSLKQWAALAKATADALFTLFSAGQAQGDSFVKSLTNIISKFDAWMESATGQTALQDFFRQGADTLKALLPILQGAQGLFDNLVTEDSIARFTLLADSLGRVLPFLGQLLDITGRVGIVSTFVELLARIGEALQPAIPALQDLADAIGFALITALDAITPLLDGLGPIIGNLATSIKPLLPVIADLETRLIKMITPALIDALIAFADAFGALVPIAIELLADFQPVIDVFGEQLAAALEAVTPLLQLLADILEALLPVVEALETPLRVLADAVGLVTLPMTALGKGIEFAGSKLHDVFTPELDASTDASLALNRRIRELGNEEGRFRNQVDAMAGAQKQQAAQTEAATEAWVAYAKGIIAAAKAQEAANVAAERNRVHIEALRDRLEELNTAGSDVIDPLERAGFAFDAAAGAAKRAADDAERLQQVFEDFIDPALNAQEAARNMAQEFADFGETIKGLIEENALADIVTQTDEATAAINLNTQAGRDFAQGLEDRIKVIEDSTTATIGMVDAQTGLAKSGGQAAREMVLLRQQLIDQVTALGLTNEQATALVDTYGLTPTSIVTTFTQANMDDAQKEALQLDENLNGIPDSIETIISMPGITQAQKNALLLDQDLDQIPDVIDTEVTTPGLKEVRAAIQGYDKDLDGIPDSIDQRVTQQGMDRARENARQLRIEARDAANQHIDQPVTQPGMDTARENARGLRGEAEQADLLSIIIPTSAPGATDADSQVSNLATNAKQTDLLSVIIPASVDDNASGPIANISAATSNLDAQSATISVGVAISQAALDVLRSTGLLQHGGQAQFGLANIAGEAGAEFVRFGRTETLVIGPTVVPPGAMVTSAALTAAELRARNATPAGPNIGKQVNNYMTITPALANPAAVATQIVNRAAAMANL